MEIGCTLERACTCIIATDRENRPPGLARSVPPPGSAPDSQVIQDSTARSSCRSGVVGSTGLYSENRVAAAVTSLYVTVPPALAHS